MSWNDIHNTGLSVQLGKPKTDQSTLQNPPNVQELMITRTSGSGGEGLVA